MIAFMISVVPPKLDWMRLSRLSPNHAGEQRSRAPAGQGRARSGPVQAIVG